MKYAHIDEKTDKILGWYDDNIHSKIPTPNIKVTEEVWQEAININANCYEDGKFIIKDFRTDKEIAEQVLNKRKQEALKYLADTGWYVERLNDPSSGKAIPEDVLAKRVEVRELINTLEAELATIGGN